MINPQWGLIQRIIYQIIIRIHFAVTLFQHDEVQQLYQKAGTSQARLLSLQTLIRTLLHQHKQQDLQGMKITIIQSSFKQGITPISRLI
jgi:hypothetical protein